MGGGRTGGFEGESTRLKGAVNGSRDLDMESGGGGGPAAVILRDGDQGEEAPAVVALGRAEQCGRHQPPGHAVPTDGGGGDMVQGSNVG